MPRCDAASSLGDADAGRPRLAARRCRPSSSAPIAARGRGHDRHARLRHRAPGRRRFRARRGGHALGGRPRCSARRTARSRCDTGSCARATRTNSCRSRHVCRSSSSHCTRRRSPPADIGRVLTLQVESLTSKLIDFAIERRGPAPVAWAWLALGSAARREFTLASDQENALAYADGEDRDAIDTYFERFAADVNRGLARCRWPPDPNHVLAESSLWRMSESAWIRTFEDCLVSPDRSHLMRANVAFDFRQIAGGLAVHAAARRRAPPRRGPPRLPAATRPHRDRDQASARLPRLARRRARSTSSGGIIPIANIARFFTLSQRHHHLGHRRAPRGGPGARARSTGHGDGAARGRSRDRASATTTSSRRSRPAWPPTSVIDPCGCRRSPARTCGTPSSRSRTRRSSCRCMSRKGCN